jgi:chromosome segregation ATPase
MRLQPKSMRVAVIVVVLAVIGSLGYLCLHLKGERDQMAASAEKAENRQRLLDQKYKEEKALAGRLQREALTLSGQARQAKMDAEKFATENNRLQDERVGMEGKVQACEGEKKRLADEIDQLAGEHKEISARLKTVEGKNQALQAEIQSLKSDLKQASSQNKRYFSNNQRLAEIAKTLAALVENQELGSSVLVKEPLIQFKKVELEKLLQNYLDGIDDAKIVQ